MTKKNGKKPSAKPSVEMVPQEHGGALLPGAGGGPQPGSGRPPNELRGTLREILERGLPVLEGYVEGRVPVKMVGKCEKCGHEHEDYKFTPADFLTLQTVKAADRLKALEMAAKYGGVAELSLTVDEQPETEMTPERLADFWERIERLKSVRQLEIQLVGEAKKQAEG